MHRISTLFALPLVLFAQLLPAPGTKAQTPQSFSYQAVARDPAGNLLANKSIGLEISILDGGSTGTVVYTETFAPQTNDQGLFTVGVGLGVPVTGSFGGINWSTGQKYLKTAFDPAGGTNYTITGTTQLMSVPYALYAVSAGTAGSGVSSSYWSASGSDISNTNPGNVGLATGGAALNNLVQIGNPPSFNGNILALGDGTNGMSFGFLGGSSTWLSNANFSLMPAFGGSGYLGIGTQTPVNKVQIGNPPGFSGNDLAIGNGAQATSFALSPAGTVWYSNTPFALMPAGGTGNVGIGTIPSGTSLFKMTIQPTANGSGLLIQSSGRVAIEAAGGDLDIDNGNASINGDAGITGDVTIGGNDPNSAALTIWGSSYSDNLTGAGASLKACNFCGTSTVAIDARSGDIWANAFYATSDARVKNIIGPSNAADDLDKLSRIQVTDYTMKDSLTNGARHFKKVIAQQVEEVYPDVIRKQKGYIPNVYQGSEAIERTGKGYLITLHSPHGLSAAAKRLCVAADGAMQTCTIVSIPSDRQVEISSSKLKSGRVFVYGEEVDDFRSVDYEGLSTLTISATQQLSRLVTQQAEAIALLKKQVRVLDAKISHRNANVVEPSAPGK